MELITWIESHVFWAFVIWYFIGSFGGLFFYWLMFKEITRIDIIYHFTIVGMMGLCSFIFTFTAWIVDKITDLDLNYWNKKVF